MFRIEHYKEFNLALKLSYILCDWIATIGELDIVVPCVEVIIPPRFPNYSVTNASLWVWKDSCIT